MLLAQDIDRIIAAPREHERLEFKEAKQQYDTETLFKYCVALSNEGGGLLLLGITDKQPRKVVGTAAFPNPDKIKSRIFSKLKFRVEVEEVTHPDGRVLAFNIPPRPAGTAFTYEGAYLMRVGESLMPMSEDMLRRIFVEGNPDFLLRYARAGASAEDVVMLLDTQSYFDLMQLPYPATRDAALARLAQEQLIVEAEGLWNITNLGALLFAKDLRQFGQLSRKAPRVVVYKGANKLETVREQIGAKGYAAGFEGLVGYINSQLPANEVIGQALRTETRMYPEIAIRELVANALVHQDLEDFGSFVMLEIYCDRIEITNPGTPLIPTDRFIDEYKSRNERLTDLMRRFRICEEKSSGIDKVVAFAEAWQLPAPDFRTGEQHTSVVLFAHKSFDDMDRKERVRACYQHACLLYVSNQKMTNQSLRERFKLAESKAEAISRIISDAVNDGKIKLDDPENRSRRYAKYIPFWG
ncbi:ATP-binding protein [Desulfovibrio legallii]|uniref:Predicted transcriptional regulator, contains HTH domain n=1 Tax=Desulfovibrio legallii TaxID=571438 RepID=A0A1G7MCW4_9BACT|nr:ATP-binding protein [Desulfovibrio legallii]SDF59541.1 Predicted transcriptional regulator, contains HTH domain [Desulfovibrio legallii]